MKRVAKITLVVISLLTFFFGYQTSRITFDYDFENFFPKGDKDTEFFAQYREQFSSDNDFILVGLESEHSIFSDSFQEKAIEIIDEINRLPYTHQVLSIYNLPGGFAPDAKLDSSRIFKYRELTQAFVADNSSSLSVLLLHEPFLKKDECDTLAARIQEISSNYDFKTIHLAGRAIAQKYYIETSQIELATFLGIGVILLIIILFFTFRTLWGVLVPLVVVLLSMIWTVGIMTFLGEPFNLLLTTLPTIVFVVGVSDVIHIVSRYLDLIRMGESNLEAVKKAFKEVGLATFLTSITTAVGFLTLLVAKIEPIKDFGLYTAIGVMVAYILAFTLLPSILILGKKPENKAIDFGGRFWKKNLIKLYSFVLKQKKSIVIASIILFLISLVGTLNLRVKNDLLEDISADNPLKQSFDFFDNNYAGVRPFEMQIKVLDSSKDVFDIDVLTELEKLESFLTEDYGVNGVVSPLSVMKTAHFVSSFDADKIELPNSKRKLRQLEKQLKKQNPDGFFFDNYQMARLSGRVQDLGNTHFEEQNKKLERFIQDSINPNLIQLQLTGSAELLDKNNRTLSMSLLQGLLLAFAVVVFLVGLIYKSFKMAFIALISNVLPILMIGSIIAFSGLQIKVSTSIIFTIAFGIAVDDTLHFINKLKIELNKGRSLALAIRTTFLSAGKAIIITSLILISGFISLIGSSFLSTFYVGLLVSLTLLFALIIDLTLLPLLILKFYKRKEAIDKE